jgi:hypothetical protein
MHVFRDRGQGKLIALIAQVNLIQFNFNRIKIMDSELNSATELRRWLTSHGGFIHPLVSLSQGARSNM